MPIPQLTFFLRKESLMKNTVLVKTLLLFSLIMAVSFLGFSKEKQLDSRWEVATVKIASFNNDWVEEALNFEKKVKVDMRFGFYQDVQSQGMPLSFAFFYGRLLAGRKSLINS